MMSNDMQFEFNIVVSLLMPVADEDAIMDALYEAGCENAIIDPGSAGIVGLGFTHAGEDAETVMSNAVKRALSALPSGVQLSEVQPDLVSLADVAARFLVSCQALQMWHIAPRSLGEVYRTSKMLPILDAQPNKVHDALERAHEPFASAAAAQKILPEHGFQVSMSGKGNCYDCVCGIAAR
jgi:hypothetical protein